MSICSHLARPTTHEDQLLPIFAGAVGGFLVGVIGVLLPPVMFWGEYEMNTLANFDNPLPYIWPKGTHPLCQPVACFIDSANAGPRRMSVGCLSPYGTGHAAVDTIRFCCRFSGRDLWF